MFACFKIDAWRRRPMACLPPLSVACFCLFVPFTAPAGLVQTSDNQTYEGNVRLGENGHLIIQSANGSRQVALEKVRLARLGLAPVEADAVPKGWSVEAIGGVQGNAREKDGRFALRVSGGSLKDPKQQAALFAHRPLRADGEVAARLESLTATNPCLAGVMMRDNLEPVGGFALLAVSQDRHLRFESREAGWRALQKQDLGAVALPVWLKLARQEKEKTVTAFRSADGKRWEKVGQNRLGCQVEAFPEGSDNWRPRVLTGLALTGPGTGAVASVRFDHLALTARGLLGEYFADDQFQTLRFARPDRQVEFHWGLNPPVPDLEGKPFSVRWTGQLEPKYSENYRFYFDADDAAQLWVNGQEMLRASMDVKSYVGKELPLQAGQKYALKCEFKNSEGMASVKLGWSSRSQAREVIPAGALAYTFDTNSPDEDGAAATTNAFAAKGIWLRNGSFIAGEIRAADDTAMQVVFAGQKEFAILTAKIARVIFRKPRRPVPFEAAKDQSGVFLKNGDFFEGEFKALKGRALSVSSVLFGQRTFRLDNPEAVALVLHTYAPEPAPFEVRLLDGSVLRARRVQSAPEGALIEDTALGAVTIPEKDLLEIRGKGEGRM